MVITEIRFCGSPSNKTEVSGETFGLSEREMEVCKHVVAGHPNGEIAKMLNTAENTVKTILVRVFAKVDVKDRTSLAVFLLRNGVLR
jgi:DNA-binding NarL/FixJ family response regulator